MQIEIAPEWVPALNVACITVLTLVFSFVWGLYQEYRHFKELAVALANGLFDDLMCYTDVYKLHTKTIKEMEESNELLNKALRRCSHDMQIENYRVETLRDIVGNMKIQHAKEVSRLRETIKEIEESNELLYKALRRCSHDMTIQNYRNVHYLTERYDMVARGPIRADQDTSWPPDHI